MCEEGFLSLLARASFPSLSFFLFLRHEFFWLSLSLTPLTDSPGSDDSLTGNAPLWVYISRDIARGSTFFESSPTWRWLTHVSFHWGVRSGSVYGKNGVRDVKFKLFIQVVSISFLRDRGAWFEYLLIIHWVLDFL